MERRSSDTLLRVIQKWQVGIVGCGVAGLAAAGALQRRGHNVTLIERAPRLGPVGAGLLLQPSGQLALQRLGLLDQVIATAEPIAGLHARTRRSRTLFHLPYRRLGPGLCGYGVHRDDLFQVLYRHAQAAGVTFRLGVTMTGSRQTASDIFALDDAGQEHGPFDVLIAADGARSRLRTAPELKAKVREFPLGAIWFSGRSDAVQGELRQVNCGGRQLGLLPLGGGRCSLFFSLPRGGREALDRRGLADLKREILELCPEADSLMRQVNTLDDLAFTRYQLVHLKRWSAGRLACIGDAAHSTTPHLGQGVNLALLDAVAIADELDRADDPIAALARATDFRRRQVMWCWRLSNVIGPLFQNQGRFISAGRDVLLPWMPRLPWVGRMMVGTMAGLQTGMFSQLQLDA